jgi:uncharacterized protein (DUF58 family)
MQQENLDIQNFRDFENLEFFARQVVEGFITGMHKSPFHGFSVEFSEHRIYNPGESTRNIDWKLYGRTDRLYTKRYEEETNLRCRLVIDTSGSMFYPEGRMGNVKNPNKLLFSSIASMALMNLLKRQRDAVGLSLFGRHDVNTPARSTFQHHKLINTELYKVLSGYNRKDAGAVSMIESLHLIAQQIHKRSLVILFSDLFEMQDNAEKLFDALQHLKYNKHEVIIFWTTDKSTELDFEFNERPYRFVDMESGQTLKLNPGEVKSHYLKEMEHFKSQILLKCMQHKIDLIEADVSRGYHPILQEYLLKRKKMF